MLNLRYLESFLLSADCGSFHKAADAMYITPSALIKQINMLEDEIGVPLFERTPRGLRLTRAGESVYRDGRALLREAENVVSRAKQSGETENIIRVGTSPVSPAEPVAAVWEKAYAGWPELRIEIVSFANTEAEVRRVFRSFGEEIDLICGVADPVHMRYRGCAGTVLEYLPLNAAVSVHHPLARKERITVNDLSAYEVMVMKEGRMEVMDEARSFLNRYDRKILIHDFDLYSIDVFNYAEKNGAVLLITDKWIKAHPAFRMIEVSWDFKVPYGLLYADHPSEKVKRFISYLVT